jgi:hypothetical protein
MSFIGLGLGGRKETLGSTSMITTTKNTFKGSHFPPPKVELGGVLALVRVLQNPPIKESLLKVNHVSDNFS